MAAAGAERIPYGGSPRRARLRRHHWRECRPAQSASADPAGRADECGGADQWRKRDGELVARAIHENSPRNGPRTDQRQLRRGPLRTCSKANFRAHAGRFTARCATNPVVLELADGGTLFLDEIGETPLGMQAKLLRVLQEQEIERVGDTRTRKVDVRIIAATNRDLRKEAEAPGVSAKTRTTAPAFPRWKPAAAREA
ncbi:MAG: sigma 54-interacting transcriptional regulator [Betaproteobacteria bacterium]|nr:sigma 54-interacting transcriptional regulator [Betaproteobacteria bacterium]